MEKKEKEIKVGSLVRIKSIHMNGCHSNRIGLVIRRIKHTIPGSDFYYVLVKENQVSFYEYELIVI